MEELVLDLARRVAQEAEVYSITSTTTPVAFEANRLKQLHTKEVRGLALRVLVNGRIGLASTTRLDQPERLVETALEMARYGAQAYFTLPAQDNLPAVQVYDPALVDLPVEELVSMGQDLIDRVRSCDSTILCDANLKVTAKTISIINSQGARHTVRKTAIAVDIHANLIRGTDMLDVYEGASSCRLAVDLAGLAQKVIARIEQARQIATIPTRPMPVIFTPKGVAMALIQPLKLALSGKVVYQGASPLGDKLGQIVADPRFSLYDDGTVDWAVASTPFDDEGTPCRRTPLIENGRVCNFYYDLQTAGMAGKVSTGNGFRALESLPAPTPTSFLIATGDASLEDMLADIKDGLLVDQTMGAWSGNLISGEFSGNVHLGYRIEGGRLVGRVKDTMVAGNIFQALRELAGIGGEAEWVENVYTPALYFKSLGVASK